MTLTIELVPELEARLLTLAAAQGLSLDHYVRRVLERQVLGGGEARPASVERAEAWRDSVRGLPLTPPLSDEAIRRETIYDARG